MSIANSLSLVLPGQIEMRRDSALANAVLLHNKSRALKDRIAVSNAARNLRDVFDPGVRIVFVAMSARWFVVLKILLNFLLINSSKRLVRKHVKNAEKNFRSNRVALEKRYFALAYAQSDLPAKFAENIYTCATILIVRNAALSSENLGRVREMLGFVDLFLLSEGLEKSVAKNVAMRISIISP